MRLAYLQALHASGSATAGTGWQPQFISVWQGDALVAACPAWLKSHSYGEYMHLCRLRSIDQMTLDLEDGCIRSTGARSDPYDDYLCRRVHTTSPEGSSPRIKSCG